MSRVDALLRFGASSIGAAIWLNAATAPHDISSTTRRAYVTAQRRVARQARDDPARAPDGQSSGRDRILAERNRRPHDGLRSSSRYRQARSGVHDHADGSLTDRRVSRRSRRHRRICSTPRSDLVRLPLPRNTCCAEGGRSWRLFPPARGLACDLGGTMATLFCCPDTIDRHPIASSPIATSTAPATQTEPSVSSRCRARLS